MNKSIESSKAKKRPTREDHLQAIKQRLLERNAQIREGMGLDDLMPDTDRTNVHEGDGGNVHCENNERPHEFDELQQITAALERFREGLYGVCSECGTNIGIARLQTLMCANTCIKCQRKLEGNGRK